MPRVLTFYSHGKGGLESIGLRVHEIPLSYVQCIYPSLPVITPKYAIVSTLDQDAHKRARRPSSTCFAVLVFWGFIFRLNSIDLYSM